MEGICEIPSLFPCSPVVEISCTLYNVEDDVDIKMSTPQHSLSITG